MDYPLLDVFWTMFVFFLWILWFMLLFRILGDLFRDDSVSGWGKTGWTATLLLLPFLGVLTYLIFRGQGMGERESAQMQKREYAFRSYVRQAAVSGPDTTDQLVRLADLKKHGDLTDEEYQRAKASLLV